VLLSLPTIHVRDREATIFLAGYELRTGLGGPPRMAEGHAPATARDIALDRGLARKLGARVGDTVTVRDTPLRVCGLTDGTNAFVIQYGFVLLPRAQHCFGYPDLVTCYLVRLEPGIERTDVERDIRAVLPDAVTYGHADFVRNNVREMESGVLPLLYTVAAIGAVVLTTILTLLLTVVILERRCDIAAMKALGAPRGFLPLFVIFQAIALVACGCAFAALLLHPFTELVAWLSPETGARPALEQVIAVTIAALTMGLCAALLSLRRVRGIYALEVFR
jgi:putative ABC transport system permease protein